MIPPSYLFHSFYLKISLSENFATEPLFPSRQQGRHITRDRVYQIYADIAEKLGRDDIGTHTLRKTFGYHYYKKTRDIATLMFIFNHSSQAITKRYIGITEDEIGASLRGFKLGG